MYQFYSQNLGLSHQNNITRELFANQECTEVPSTSSSETPEEQPIQHDECNGRFLIFLLLLFWIFMSTLVTKNFRFLDVGSTNFCY